MKRPATPTAFAGPDGFRSWLERHHGSEKELLVRCCKSHAKHKGITYTQALDEALCFGWIDGVRRRVDDDAFSVRFSPRKPKSKWSDVNIRRARQLEAAGRMRPPGLAAFHARGQSPRSYSYESRPVELDPAYATKFRAIKRAWAYFQARPPWYRRTSAFWVMSAEREETRFKRLGILIECSKRGTTIPLLTRTLSEDATGRARRPGRRG